jgi:hypothetical protein
MTNAQTPANWYPDPNVSGQLRYWDGSVWTEHVAPGSPSTAVVAPPSSVVEPGSAKAPDPAPGTSVSEPPARSKGGLFGGKRSLETEVEELRRFVDGFGYGERHALQAEIEQLRSEADRLRGELAVQRAEVTQLSGDVVKVREELILQEVGIYDYHHRLEDSIAYATRLDQLRQQLKAMAKRDGGAVIASTNWTVEGSAAKGRTMVNEISKLLLRAYNGEADVLVNKMRPYKLDAAVDQLNKARATITRLGKTMSISISEAYHQLRLEELRLVADFLAKKEAEKEAEREEKIRLREEAQARKEFEAEKARLLKEQAHYTTALERIRQTGSEAEVAAATAKLAEISAAIHGVEEREANIRAGYVYVISNVGAFGPHVVKIGMTRRLEPLDRVRELGDASVPFRYDVHAIVFSEDAVSLEGRLHQVLADRRLNLVNPRREFFFATPAEVKALLAAADGSLLEFIEEPEADEWHQSTNTRRHSDESRWVAGAQAPAANTGEAQPGPAASPAQTVSQSGLLAPPPSTPPPSGGLLPPPPNTAEPVA